MDRPTARSAGSGGDARGRLAALIRDLAPEAAAAPARPRRVRAPDPAEPDGPIPSAGSAERDGSAVSTDWATPTGSAEPGGSRRLLPTRPAPRWASGSAGRLVERWVPGGAKGVDGVRALAGRHRLGTAAVAFAVLAAVSTAIVLGASQPTVEPAPPLPAALSSVPVASAAATSAAVGRLVVSVVGRVAEPGLVTVSNGARVADALRAAGGMAPGTDFGALNLARRLADGEQVYVGVPVPSGAAEAPPDQPTAAQPAPDPAADAAPAPAKPGRGKKSGAGAGPGGKVNLNTATAAQLETLPGVGPATAQRIVTWRTQHGRFASISQLRDVGGIGVAKFAKLQPLVTT